jgi:signal transduction histidine kinase
MMLVGPRFLEASWRVESAAFDPAGAFDVALTDTEGRIVMGDPRVSLERQSSRNLSASDLPWTVHVIERDVPPVSLSRQAMVMLAALGVMMCVVGAGGYVVTRALARELRVARLQSDFVAAVSHEFRTPLTTMRHLSVLLARERVATDARRREFYGILVRESDRLQRLVESLLNLGRLESGEQQYRFEPVDPGACLRRCVDELREERMEGGGQITLEGDENSLPAIRADQDVLGRVFWNLLDNAVKYSPDDADVHVGVGAVGGQVVVKIRDHGMGIRADEQRHVFQKFVRGSAAKAASIKGTGIGLAMAREIVVAHGGTITVESQEGVGSTFIVRLPAMSAAAVARPAAPSAPPAPPAPVGPS